MRRSAVVVVLVLALCGGVALGWWSNGMVADVAPEPVQVPRVLTVEAREGVLDDAILVEAGYDFVSAGVIRGAGVVTAAPVADTVVAEGESPFEYELVPQFVLVGERPMFRDLVAGTHGGDVVQLHAALHRLGYDVDAEGKVVTTQTLRAWRDFLLDRDVEFARAPTRIGSGELAFVADLPARIGQVATGVGELASGVVAELEELEPSVFVVLPASIPYARVEVSPVFLISPVDQSLVEALVTSSRTGDDGALRLGLDADVPDEWLGLPLRGRIGGSADSEAGTIVPLAAISTVWDGTGMVHVLDASGTQRAVDVRVLATTRTEAMIAGDVEPGDAVVIGQ